MTRRKDSELLKRQNANAEKYAQSGTKTPAFLSFSSLRFLLGELCDSVVNSRVASVTIGGAISALGR
jgi:hypothetical protein